MSTTYILEELGKIKPLKGRQEEAVRLFRCFDNHIPTGGSNPPIYPGDLESDGGIRENEKWAESFYQQIRDLCGGNLPAEIQKLYGEFQKNRARTEELLSLSTENRRKLEIHERFPYWNNFNGAVHNIFKNSYGCWSTVDLEAITFLPDIIAKGGFATIYTAEDKEGKKYALKLFYPLETFPTGFRERNNREKDYNQIAQNIWVQRELFSKEPFAYLRAAPCPKSGYGAARGYLMDFIPGQTIRESLESKLVLPDEFIGRVLMTYAQMLDSLHSQNKLFVDNNWGAVIANNGNIKICDYDFVTSVENVASDEFHVFEARYGSREHYLKKGLNASSDLEGFSLMIDHILVRASFLAYSWEDQEKNRAIAKSNKRRYPGARIAKLPNQLKRMVPALINYPRDNSITAKDFVSAIKEDYKI